MQNRLYVLTRNDLAPGYRAVQAGHAVAEYLLKNRTTWDNGYLIYLAVKDEEELKYWMDKLSYRSKVFAAFREPDLGDQITAIAAEDDGRLFKSLRLSG